MKILITGVAGFIGFHLAQYLLNNLCAVIGIDNLNSYYDPNLKRDRLVLLNRNADFVFYEANIADEKTVSYIFSVHKPDFVIHLAAQAGVRFSIKNPNAYIESNIVGFFNVLEACRNYNAKHLLYASSSSVYGGNKVVPFNTNHNVDHPISLYAATKKSNELMAHAYSHLYSMPSTGLRFFTVYGPWGRPDMAYFSFTKAILEGQPIALFNHGHMERDFTYIDDVVESIIRLIEKIPTHNVNWDETTDALSSSFAPYRLYNVGNNNPILLNDFISVLEDKLGMKSKKVYMDMQPGDVLKTYADISNLERDICFKPSTSIEDGLARFVEWYKDYYHI